MGQRVMGCKLWGMSYELSGEQSRGVLLYNLLNQSAHGSLLTDQLLTD